MNSRPSDPALDRALSELGAIAAPSERPSAVARRRDRIVGALGAVLGGVRSRRRFVRRARYALLALTSLAAAAALAVMALRGAGWGPGEAAAHPLSPLTTRAIEGEVVVRELGQRPFIAAGGESLGGGETLETEAGSSIELALASGRVRVGGQALVEVRRPNLRERRLRLKTGAVDVDLPARLPNGQALVLETPDVEVRVVGTAFSVNVNGAAGEAMTRVAVRRGTVWILKDGQRRAVLGAGQTWASQPAREPVAEAAPAPPAAAALDQAPARDVRPAKVASGTLAEENRLFEAALAARNAGDDRRAAEIFGSLLAKYPRSVLAEQALAERFRAQHRAGQTSAAIAGARRYLSSYARGFARADAERIAGAAAVAP